jgi:hypothetical protein
MVLLLKSELNVTPCSTPWAVTILKALSHWTRKKKPDSDSGSLSLASSYRKNPGCTRQWPQNRRTGGGADSGDYKPGHMGMEGQKKWVVLSLSLSLSPPFPPPPTPPHPQQQRNTSHPKLLAGRTHILWAVGRCLMNEQQ